MTASLARRWNSSGVLDHRQLRQAAVARLLELERGVGARELALQQRHFLLPGHRHEVDVLQAPGVVLLADAGRAVLRRRLRVQPGDEPHGRFARRGDRLLERAAAALGLLRERIERVDLLAHRARAGDPEVARVAGQVALAPGRGAAGRRRAPSASFASPSRSSGNWYVQTSTMPWCSGPSCAGVSLCSFQMVG